MKVLIASAAWITGSDLGNLLESLPGLLLAKSFWKRVSSHCYRSVFSRTTGLFERLGWKLLLIQRHQSSKSNKILAIFSILIVLHEQFTVLLQSASRHAYGRGKEMVPTFRSGILHQLWKWLHICYTSATWVLLLS